VQLYQYARPAVGSTPTPGPTVGPESNFIGAIGFRLDGAGIAEVGRVVHDPVSGSSPQIHRSLVIGNRLFTLSDAGIMASRLATLGREAFIALPQPPAPRPKPISPPRASRGP
jgi:hypothetical protein